MKRNEFIRNSLLLVGGSMIVGRTLAERKPGVLTPEEMKGRYVQLGKHVNFTDIRELRDSMLLAESVTLKGTRVTILRTDDTLHIYDMLGDYVSHPLTSLSPRYYTGTILVANEPMAHTKPLYMATSFGSAAHWLEANVWKGVHDMNTVDVHLHKSDKTGEIMISVSDGNKHQLNFNWYKS